MWTPLSTGTARPGVAWPFLLGAEPCTRNRLGFRTSEARLNWRPTSAPARSISPRPAGRTTVVAQLIKENRKLKRQVVNLTAKATNRASGTVDRSLRAIQKRAQKALGAPIRRRRRTATKRTVRKKTTG